jgi:putative ABC transport system permease protein
VGVVITVLSALLPARRANRITPLEALRPVDDQATERRTTVVRRAGSLALCVTGCAGIWYGLGDAPYALLAAIGGAFVAAVGLLSSVGLFLPWLLRGLSRLIAGAGPTVRLAGDNTLRNPGRSAATCVALMLAVGLVVTLQVGAASLKATVNSSLSTRFPVDVTVSMFDGPLPDRAVTDVAGVPGITTAVGVRSTRIRFGADADSTDLRVLGPDAAALSLLSEPRPPIADDVLLADPFLLE